MISSWIIYWITIFFALLFTLISLAIELPDALGYGTKMNLGPLARLIRTAVCAMGAIAVYYAPINKKTGFFIPAAFLLATIADYFLIIQNNLIVGIGFFAVMQILLIIRHNNGVPVSHYKKQPIKKIIGLMLLLLLITNTALWPFIESIPLKIVILVYSIILSISFIAAFGTLYQDKFPSKQAKYAFRGLLLFVLCDITVAIGAAFPELFLGQVVRSLTGIFYTPSLLYLLASGLEEAREI